MNTYKSSYTNKKSKLLQGILLGALAGAAISMLDRNTRESAIEGSKKRFRETKDFIQHPDRCLVQIKDTSNKIRSTIESITEDVAFISGKVEELKEIPPQVATVVKETKVAFTENEELKQDETKQ